MIGTTLRHYRIERALGSGGMGEVFLAQDTKLHRHVALKILPTATASDPERLKRFQREAQAVAALNHPNVVTIFSVEESDGIHFLTMEVIDGQMLSAFITRKGLPLKELFSMGVPLVDAVAAAHGRGIVHRDLKPGNVMLSSDGRLKVLDFGLAKLKSGIDDDPAMQLADTDSLTNENRIAGTPQYMSPEQAEGRVVDARSDIFSLGVILYEMATGKLPFHGATVVSIISSIIKDAPEPIVALRPDLPLELDRILRKCLAKDPMRRYQSAHDLRNDLEELQQQVASGDALVAPPNSRKQTLRWVTAVLIVAAFSGAFYLLSLRRSSPQQPELHARFSQLTAQPGVEWSPSLSPDGKWVIYSGEHEGNREIYLHSVSGQNPINLTKDPADDDQPAFSHDGERIAFRSSRDGGGIFVMGRTGEAVRKVSPTGFNPAWSPDSSQIVFTSEKMEINPQNSEGRSSLSVVSVNGGEPKRLFEGDAVQPNWSPHNRRIAYAMRLGTARQMDIWTIPVTGGTPTPVMSDPATDWNPVWSPDGKYLYFGSDRAGSLNLWRVAIDEVSGKTAGKPEPITTPAAFLAHPTISANGRQLAYSSVLLGQNVQKLSFDPLARTVSGQPFDVTRGSRLWSSPDPSADGQWVAFYSRVQPEGDLYIERTDGTGIRQVTGDPAIDRVPRWSPDGRWIAFFSNRSGKIQIWKVRPDGSELQQITDMEASIVTWSPDGSRMATGSGATSTSEAVVFDPDRPWKEQTPQVLPPIVNQKSFVPNSWSSDGTRLVGQSGFTPGILTHTLGTRTYDRVLDYGEWPVWLPDGQHILFVSGGKEFAVVDSRMKQVQKIFSVTRDVIGPPRLTRDGREMYFSRRVTEGDIWLVDFQ